MSRKVLLPAPTPSLRAEQAAKVRAELELILGSVLFRSSHRCQSLLRRITEQTLAGDAGSLKERTLGVEVFGRSPDYDTSQDPVVRTSAAELRKKLAQYYQETGHKSHVQIELPSRSYVPEFDFAPGKETAAVTAVQPRKWYMPMLATVVVTGLLILAFNLISPNWRRSDLDRFWEPVLKAPGPVLVCVGLQAAYNPRSVYAQDAIEGVFPPQAIGPGQRAIREDDLILLRDRYVALDDAVCLVRLTSLLERYRKPYRIRAERLTSFADLRDGATVLIGAFDNVWTLRTSGHLRFTFEKDREHNTDRVVDRQHPENAEWKLTNSWPEWDVPIDYAIVSRIVDPTTDRQIVIAAGLTQYGTIAAGEFLSNAEYFADAGRRLPPAWQKKNLQIVLRVPVVNRVSGRPRILATHVW